MTSTGGKIYSLQLNRGKAYQVGVDRITIRGKRKYFLYKDCIPAFESWYDVSFYLPHPFDLCVLQTPSSKKIGWWTGEEWFGKLIKQNEPVLFWKLLNTSTL